MRVGQEKKIKDWFAGQAGEQPTHVKPKTTDEGKYGRKTERCSTCELRLDWGCTKYDPFGQIQRKNCPTK